MNEKLAEMIEDSQDIGELQEEADTPQGAIALVKRFALEQWLEVPVGQREIVLCSDMGTDNQSMKLCKISELAEQEGGRLNCLVLPANLSETERQAVLRWQ